MVHIFSSGIFQFNKPVGALDKPRRDHRAMELQASKKKFLRKAAQVMQRIQFENTTVSRQQPHPELESLESLEKSDQFDIPLITSEVDDNPETEPKRVSGSTDESTQEEDGTSMNIEQEISCIQSCCTKIKDMLDSTKDIKGVREAIQESVQLSQAGQTEEGEVLPFVPNQTSFVMEEEGRDIGKPGYYDTSGSASDLQQNRMRTVEFTLGTDSSDQESQQAPVAVLSTSRDSYCWMQCPNFCRMALSGNRRHTITEGDLDPRSLSQHSNMCMIPQNMTHPLMRLHDGGNDWLSTGGRLNFM